MAEKRKAILVISFGQHNLVKFLYSFQKKSGASLAAQAFDGTTLYVNRFINALKPAILKKHLVAMFYLILLQPCWLAENVHVMSKRQLFTLEFPVRCSPSILYDFLSTPAGLQEWFADKVDEWEGVYSFTWNGEAPDKAEFVDSEEDKFVRFRWLHNPKDEYFEFRIEKTEISNQTILTITDFAEKGEIKDQSQLWEYQIKELFHRLGS